MSETLFWFLGANYALGVALTSLENLGKQDRGSILDVAIRVLLWPAGFVIGLIGGVNDLAEYLARSERRK